MSISLFFFFQVENIEDFKRLCEINCKGDEEIKDMVELRRKIKNRVSFPDSLSLQEFKDNLMQIAWSHRSLQLQ